ncbi:MAG: peptidylprolyl isomerase [Magnetospirillum sp.]
MIVADGHVVTLTYQTTDHEGTVVDEGHQPLSYLHGGYDDIFPKLERELTGKTVGQQVRVELAARDAFGEYDKDLVRLEPLEVFGRMPKIGALYERDDAIYKAVEIRDGKVVLDGNHPLAGLDIVFSATIADIRPATAEELAGKVKVRPASNNRRWVLAAVLLALGALGLFVLAR